ncbi:MAG: SDR family oxidoreductase [Betaproteobacteria bacterium]|nr:SDR family oxidoreductase [Betaproteobacteria bacterium]
MDLGLQGKNALITGCCRDIGSAIAKVLAEEGCNVAFAVCAGDDVAAAVAASSRPGIKAVPIAADFLGEGGCRTFVESAVAALGGCDILVNNAGVGIPGRLDSLTPEQWQQAIDVSLMSYVYTTKSAIPHLRKARAGRILNVSGISGTMLIPGTFSTALPNAAIIRFGKLMANDLAPYNVLVNTLCPGTVEGASVDQTGKALAGMTMLNRLARPEEIGWIAAFLVSEKNSYMTGTTIESCGGATKYL